MVEPAPKIGSTRSLRALSFWHGVLATGLHELPYDLSTRQMAILLHVYLQPPAHSIKSLSEILNISKPATCRAISALERGRLVKRMRDKIDKRNVVVQRTVKGSVFLSEFAEVILKVSKKMS